MADLIRVNEIRDKIFTVREIQVILDSDLAELFQVETRVLNQAVKRNIARFPESFRFQLTREEDVYIKSEQVIRSNTSHLKSQIVISSSEHGGRRKLPSVFTEQGVSMLSALLRSEVAIDVSIQIINEFVHMRKFLINNADIFIRLSNLEQNQIHLTNKQNDSNDKINQILRAIEEKELKPRQGIFFDGQLFDAYLFVSDLIKSARKSIILIDNFIDETVLELFKKRDEKVLVTIYTKSISKLMKQDVKKFNAQYPRLVLKELATAHDRFMIIDNRETYHIGASLKDLGKKWFAFSKLDLATLEILKKLEN